MNSTVRNNIYNDILEISDLEKQKRYWLNQSDGHSSSFNEVMCRLFDDNDFDNFTDEISKTYVNYPNFINELNLLKDLLNIYDERDKEDIEILADPKWLLINEQAKKVTLLWKSINW